MCVRVCMHACVHACVCVCVCVCARTFTTFPSPGVRCVVLFASKCCMVWMQSLHNSEIKDILNPVSPSFSFCRDTNVWLMFEYGIFMYTYVHM